MPSALRAARARLMPRLEWMLATIGVSAGAQASSTTVSSRADAATPGRRKEPPMTTASAVPPTLADHLGAPLRVGAPDIAGALAVFPVYGPAPRLEYRSF